MQREESPIKILQEYARRNNICLEYRFENESGPVHAKMFTVRLHLAEKCYTATERNIKLAQRTAAQLALNDCRNVSSMNNNTDEDLLQLNILQSPLAALNLWATRTHTPIRYVLLNDQYSRSYVHYRLYLGHNFYFDGHASTDQQARINCAWNALFFLRHNSFSSSSSPPSSPLHSHKSPISLMYERAKQLALPVRLEIIDPVTVRYLIGEKYSATGHGLNKHTAKQSAAEQLLAILPQTNPISRVYQLAQSRQVKIEFLPLLTEEKNYRIQLKFGEHDQVEGQGQTKQLAKRVAAENLLSKLETVVVLPAAPAKGLLKRDGHKQEKKHVHFLDDVIEKDEQSSTRVKSIHRTNRNKQELIELCAKCQIQIEYHDESNENENVGSSRYQSLVSLSNNVRLLAQFRGYGPSILRAQENASSAAWNYLKQIYANSSI